MKKIQLPDYQVESLKEDSKGVLKDSYRILEFTTQTHQSEGCLYCDYFDHEQEALDYGEENKRDSNCEILVLKAAEILEKLNEFNEVVY
jgi:hypothetical protein